MKIFKTIRQAVSLSLISVAALVFIISCGVKSSPIPKDTLKIPFPQYINVLLQDGGILIENNDNYTVLAERAENQDGVFTNRMYSRLSMIQSNGEYLDQDVEEGKTYTYRFRNYNNQYSTYSIAVTRTIKYFAPVELGPVKIDQYLNSACVSTELTSSTEYAEININGRLVQRLEKEGSACFDLPNSLIINIMIIPYDYDGNPGKPYEDTIKRDEQVVLLPPQNIKALRDDDKIVLTWDNANNIDEFAIYKKEDGRIRLIKKTNITIYQYQLSPDDECVDFEMSSIRDVNESDKVRVTSCP